MQVSISAENSRFIEQVVAEGQFASSDDAVNHAICRLRMEELSNGEADRNSESVDEWVADVRAWADSHPKVTHFVDDSRESIYAGRGE